MKNKWVLLKKRVMRGIYRLIYYIDCAVLYIFKCIGKLLKQEDFALNLMLPFCEASEVMSDCYVTCKFRPKESKAVLKNPYCNEKVSSQIAIVIQGPIIKKNDFTLETVRLYQKIYPDITVIVSTWEGLEERDLESFKSIDNCFVVLNKRPSFSGRLNINYQIVSTMAGLQYAKKLGKKYAFKIRSDMRLCKAGIFDELYSLVQKYPCFDDYKLAQDYRIVVFNAYVARPFNFSDFYMFGYIDDMLNYWNTSLQNCSSESGYVVANQMETEEWNYRKVFASKLAPEIEITRDYVERINGVAKCEIQSYWDIIRSNFITLPHTYLDVLWYKYDYNREENYIQKTYVRGMYGGDRKSMLTFSFNMWLDLFEGQFSLKSQEYEQFLDELA